MSEGSYQIGPKWAWVTPLSVLVGTFFAASYYKTALASGMAYKKEQVDSEHICDLWPKMHFDTNH